MARLSRSYYLSRSADAENIAIGLRDSGAIVYMVQADVSDPTALTDAIGEIASHFGRLDVLVNVAGMAIVGPLESYADDAFDRIFALNVRAPFLAAKAASKVMREGGRIITIGSIVADRMPGAGGTLYAASKSALGGLTRGLARDLGARGITANLIQPGPVDTERNPADGPNAEANRATLAISRHGTPDEVAGLVAYLASPRCGVRDRLGIQHRRRLERLIDAYRRQVLGRSDWPSVSYCGRFLRGGFSATMIFLRTLRAHLLLPNFGLPFIAAALANTCSDRRHSRRLARRSFDCIRQAGAFR